MIKEKLLTIAVPTYNGSSTIGNMLSILLPQCDNRVEVLICNNCSSDDTEEVIQQYINQYPFIRYIKNDKNIGPDSNFLKCMGEASGRYTLLLSDDDILVENALNPLLNFLDENDDLSLVYLNAVGFYENYKSVDKCIRYERAIYDDRNFVTNSRIEFMNYAGRMWGFLSCFICLTDAFKSLKNTEQYKKTNWLQSYIHILCSEYGEKRLGIVGNITIAAGIYSIISNFDSAQVDGINYRKMLDFAVAHGYDQKQLDDLFVWRICFISKRAVVKEKASGLIKTDIRKLVSCTKKYPKAWITLYPFIFAPRWLCIFVVKQNEKRKYTKQLQVNRQDDIVG